MTQLLACPDGAARLVSRLHANVGGKLSQPQLELLKRMLVVDPERRAPLSELLMLTYFKTTCTVERAQVTMLGLFCCPKVKWIDPVDGRQKQIPMLQLQKEMRSAVISLPPGERELRPAARFPDDLLKPLGRGDLNVTGVSPRVMHFGGHGVNNGILMEDNEGRRYIPTAEEFIATLRECRQVCPGIECIFLNSCNTFTLAKGISRDLPDVIVISWASKVSDQAASCFAAGFYSYLGAQCRRGNRKGSLVEAFRAGEAEFYRKYLAGDPDQPLPLPLNVQGPCAKGHGVLQILPRLRHYSEGERS